MIGIIRMTYKNEKNNTQTRHSPQEKKIFSRFSLKIFLLIIKHTKTHEENESIEIISFEFFSSNSLTLSRM